jgi:hypothetical protein
MFSIQKTHDGVFIQNRVTKQKICGHNFDPLINFSIGCRKELKDLFFGEKLVTFDFIKNLMENKTGVNVMLPVFDEYIEEMLKTDNHVLLEIKNSLEQNTEESNLRFIEDFLLVCREYAMVNRVIIEKLISNDFDLHEDINETDSSIIDIYFVSTEGGKESYYQKEEYEMLIIECDRSPRIKLDTLLSLRRFFSETETKIKFLTSVPYSIERIVNFVEQLESKNESLWLTSDFSDLYNNNGPHSNQILISRSENEIFITFLDPQLNSNKLQERFNNKKYEIDHSQDLMMTHIYLFVKCITGKKVYCKRKVIQDSCNILGALQSKIDLDTGLCLLYSIFMASTYIINKKNDTLKNNYHNVEDDVTCFFALLDNGAIYLLAIFFYSLFRRHPEIRKGIFDNIDLSKTPSLRPLVKLYKTL